MSRSVSKSIAAAVLASAFILISSALYRGAPAQPDAQQALPAELESVSELESLPGDDVSAASSSFGVCAYTCEPCWHTEDCPLLGGFPQACQWACY
jgi:hypothetical protein